MRLSVRRGAWIYFALVLWIFIGPLITGGLFITSAYAQPEPGINVTVYDNFGYDGSPPIPSESGRPVQCTTTYLSIDQDFGDNICGLYDDYIVKYEGYITSPTTETITFYPSADDGTKLYIDNILVDDNWVDKGGGGNPSTPIDFIAGVPKPITLWFYENGGGNWVQLSWSQGDNYSIVPAEAFTQNNESQYTTTTTSAPYLNTPQNLTAIANPDGSVDLDWDAPEVSNVDIYAYSVSFYDLTVIGGAASGGWGVWTNQGTNYSLAEYMFSGSNPVTTGFGPVRFGIKAGNQSCFSNEGIGPCVYGPEITVDATVIDPTPPTTTTSSTTSTSLIPTTTSTTTTSSTTSTSLMPTTTSTTTTIEEEVPLWTTTTVLTLPATVTTIEPINEAPSSENYPEADGPAASLPQYAPEQETTTQTDEPPVVVPTYIQEAADAGVEDIFDGPMSDAKLEDAVDDLIADAGTPEELTAVVSSLLDQELSDAQFSTVIDSVFDGPMSNENFAAAVDAVFADPTQLSDAQFENAVTAVFDGPLSDAQFEDAVSAVFEDTSKLSDEQFDAAVQTVFDGPLSTEQFTNALEAVFDEPISDEKFDAIIGAVLDEPISNEQFEELVGVLESNTVTEEQVAAAVDSVIENGVTEDQAVDLATSEKVLQSIDGEQATEIFDAVDIGAVTPEEAAQLVEAVQEAPTEVREAMESEINVFDGAIDTYVPLGSAVDIGVRRVVIAATAVLSITALPTSSSSGGSSGASVGGSSGGPSDSGRRRK